MSNTAFKKKVEHSIKSYEKAIGRTATVSRRMVDEHGEIEALSRLVKSPNLQKGFKILRDHGQLDKTFEAVVVEFQHLFKPDALKAAKWRLANADKLL